MKCSHERLSKTINSEVLFCNDCGEIIDFQSEVLKGKNEKLVSENNELKAWIREVELKNDALEKENEILRKCLKEVL